MTDKLKRPASFADYNEYTKWLFDMAKEMTTFMAENNATMNDAREILARVELTFADLPVRLREDI